MKRFAMFESFKRIGFFKTETKLNKSKHHNHLSGNF